MLPVPGVCWSSVCSWTYLPARFHARCASVLKTATSCAIWQGCTSDVALFNVKNPFYAATVPVCPAVTDPAFYTGERDEDNSVIFFVWNN
jgi:hypothetical protein